MQVYMWVCESKCVYMYVWEYVCVQVSPMCESSLLTQAKVDYREQGDFKKQISTQKLELLAVQQRGK